MSFFLLWTTENSKQHTALPYQPINQFKTMVCTRNVTPTPYPRHSQLMFVHCHYQGSLVPQFPCKYGLLNLRQFIIRIIYFYYLFFHRVPLTSCVSCRSFEVNATFSTGLVGCWSFFQTRRQKKLQRPTRHVENDALATRGLQERKHNFWVGRRWKIKINN